MTCSEVIAVLRPRRVDLASRFGVRSLALFGSVARGEEDETSDVDLLVEFDRPVGLFALFSLQDELERLMGRRVDLGTRNSLKPRIRDEILAESVDVLSTMD